MSGDPIHNDLMDDVQRFFRDRHPSLSRSTVRNVVEPIFENGVFFPLQRKRELEWMHGMARRVNDGFGPLVAMEIGAASGASVYHWLMCHPGICRFVAVEISGIPYQRIFEKAFPDVEFLWLEASSYSPETFDRVREFLGADGRLDCIFLDGDKNAFESDFEYYWPLVKPGGMAFIHDIFWTPDDGVPTSRFFQSLRRFFPTSSNVDLSEGFEELALQSEGKPPRNSYHEWLRHWPTMSCGVGVVHKPRF